MLLIGLAVVSSTVAFVTFILYAKASMQVKEEKEKQYLKIHYSSLFILFTDGLIYIL